MNYYEGELGALRRSGRLRSREVVDLSLRDFASNDYLGLASRSDLHQSACSKLETLRDKSPKASMLVGGYHSVHREFEHSLCRANGFEDGVMLGSGFNANIALIEALVRKSDELFMDEAYHASGVLASRLSGIKCTFFAHNDPDALEDLLKNSTAKRRIVAVEGIYSMDGDMLKREFFELCKKYDAIMIVDEAHSSGVVGSKLMGVYDHYGIKVEPNHIKMGTLGKAYGSFGAYILASNHIIEYLINRAKAIIYATSLSLYDTILAHCSLEYILAKRDDLKREIALNQRVIKEELGISADGLIVPIVVGDNRRVLAIKEELARSGYAIGAIREPTVPRAIIRLIARLGHSEDELRELCQKLAKML